MSGLGCEVTSLTTSVLGRTRCGTSTLAERVDAFFITFFGEENGDDFELFIVVIVFIGAFGGLVCVFERDSGGGVSLAWKDQTVVDSADFETCGTTATEES